MVVARRSAVSSGEGANARSAFSSNCRAGTAVPDADVDALVEPGGGPAAGSTQGGSGAARRDQEPPAAELLHAKLAAGGLTDTGYSGHTGTQGTQDPQRTAEGALSRTAGWESDNPHERDESVALLARNLRLSPFVAEAGEIEARWAEQLDHNEVRYKPGWQFVRLCRAHPSICNMKPLPAARRVIQALLVAAGVNELGREALELAGGWADTQDEFVARFCDAWLNIRFLPGEGPLDAAARRAAEQPLPLESAATAPGYVRLVTLAAYLQVARGDRPVYLPCRKLGDRLGLDRTTVSKFLRLAVSEGILEPVRSYRPSERKANEFRVDLSLWPDRFPAQAS